MKNKKIEILLVNPPTLVVGTPDYETSGTLFSYTIENINPGILSIASYVYSKANIKIIDLSISKKFTELEDYLKLHSPDIIGISSTCCYDYLETLKCLEIAHELSPNSLLVVGGQHGGTLGKLIFDDCNYLDLLIKYEGEKIFEQLIDIVQNNGNFYSLNGVMYNDKERGCFYNNDDMPELVSLDEMPPPHFELYPNYSYFTPYVEESRGCPNRCLYCVNCMYKKRAYRYKSAEKLIQDLDHTISFFGKEPFYALLSANFGVNPKNTLEMARQIKKRNIHWGTGFGVENHWEEYIDELKDAGLRMLCIGMESASEEILARMRKTANPSNYLKRAEKLIIKAHELGLNPAVNIMSYIGENQNTMKETLDYLLRLQKYIHRVDAYSVFEFQGTEVSRNFEEYSEKYGCSRVESEYARNTHVFPINISKDISYSASQNYCELLKYLFTNEKVAKLKSDSYKYKELNSILSE